MHRRDLISRPRIDKTKSHHIHGFLASFVLHGLGLGLIFLLAVFYHEELKLPKSGSAPGAPTITLEKMTIISAPPESPPPQQLPAPPLPTPPTPLTAISPPREHMAAPPPPEATVPVLALQTSKPTATPRAKTQPDSHPTVSHPITAATQSQTQRTASSTPSSYSPGIDALPHPPYPLEARNHGQTGTVVMNVEFDAEGSVAAASVAQSSGVAILDSATRSFIRAHWHNPSFAGQTISVPVEYTLRSL